MTLNFHRSRLRPLLFLPLLLLVPLGVLKWRADQRREWLEEHPPLSKQDKGFRALLSDATQGTVTPKGQITGEGEPWKRWTGANSGTLFLTDRAALREMGEVLRCSDQRELGDPRLTQGRIIIRVTTEEASRDYGVGNTASSSFDLGDGLVYWKTPHSSYVTPIGDFSWAYRVRPRFVPRFEAFLSRCIQRAQGGKTPGYKLTRAVES